MTDHLSYSVLIRTNLDLASRILLLEQFFAKHDFPTFCDIFISGKSRFFCAYFFSILRPSFVLLNSKKLRPQ